LSDLYVDAVSLINGILVVLANTRRGHTMPGQHTAKIIIRKKNIKEISIVAKKNNDKMMEQQNPLTISVGAFFLIDLFKGTCAREMCASFNILSDRLFKEIVS
jgi:hypothetical protein